MPVGSDRHIHPERWVTIVIVRRFSIGAQDDLSGVDFLTDLS